MGPNLCCKKKRRIEMSCDCGRKKRKKGKREKDKNGRFGFFKKWEVQDTFRKVQNSIALPMLSTLICIDWASKIPCP